MLADSLIALLPEIVLSVYSMVIIMVGVFSKKVSTDISCIWFSCVLYDG